MIPLDKIDDLFVVLLRVGIINDDLQTVKLHKGLLVEGINDLNILSVT